MPKYNEELEMNRDPDIEDDMDKDGSAVDRYFNLNQLVEIEFGQDKTFLTIAETLTRVGIREGRNTIKQVCFILSKKGTYYIVHINELRKMDGEAVDITDDDIAKRNLIVNLLVQWKLVRVLNPDSIRFPVASPKELKIIPHHAKANWDLVADYDVGWIKKGDSFNR